MRTRFNALRVHLHKIEVDRACADLRCHLEAVARFAVNAVEEIILHLRREHRLVGAVAARSENHRLRGKFNGVPGGIRRLHADHAARLVADEFLRAGFKHELPAHAEELVLHQVKEVDRAALDAELTVRGVVRILRCGRTVRNLHVVDEPVDNAAHLFGHHFDENRVVPVLADAEDVLVGKFRRILRLMHHVALVFRPRRDEGAGIQNRRAADGRHLFNEDHLLAEGFGLDGSGNARAAGTDHDDVGIFLNDLLRGLLGHDGSGKLRRVAARSADRVRNSAFDAVRGHRGARHGINAGRLSLDDFAGHARERGVRDAGRFGVLHDLHVGNVTALHSHFNDHGAVPALAFTRPGAVLQGSSGCGGGKHAAEGERNAEFGEFLHFFSPYI